MTVARADNTATLLGDGSVLLAGGLSSNFVAPYATATSELFQVAPSITPPPPAQP